MQHDHVLKKLTFDLLTRSGGWGCAGKIFADILLYNVIPFNLVCDIKLNFDLFTPSQGLWGEGVWAIYLLPCCCICDGL